MSNPDLEDLDDQAGYATAEEVEKYLGFSLSDDEAEALESYLFFLSLVIDDEAPDASLTRKNAVSVRKGARFAVELGRSSNIVQVSKTVGDVSGSTTFRAPEADDEIFYVLTKTEKRLLGIAKVGFKSWKLNPDGKDTRSKHAEPTV